MSHAEPGPSEDGGTSTVPGGILPPLHRGLEDHAPPLAALRQHRKVVAISMLAALALILCGAALTVDSSLIVASLLRDSQSQRNLIQLESHRRAAQAVAPEAELSPEEDRKLLGHIEEEFVAWESSGITLEMVEAAYCCADLARTFRLQVISGKIYVAGETHGWEEFPRLTKMNILELSSHWDLPDVDMVLTTNDLCPSEQCNGTCGTLSPILSQCKRADETRCIAMPDFTFQGWPSVRRPPWKDLLHMMREPADRLTWDQKKPDLFFRGAPTSESRRILMHDQAFMSSNLTDVVVGSWRSNITSFTSLPAHCAHRYNLILPGYGWPARQKDLALCKSVLIYPNNEIHEYWDFLLENMTHFIQPAGLDDQTRGNGLLALVKELEENPHQAKKIAEAGTELVRRLLHPDNVQRYWASLFSTYAKLQKFRPRLHPDAVPLADSITGFEARGNVETRTCSQRCPLRQSKAVASVSATAAA